MKTLMLLIAIFVVGITNAQQQVDVVYLKNQSVIKGTITEYNPNQNIKIEVSSGNILVISMSDIDRIEKEAVQSMATEPTPNKTSGTPATETNSKPATAPQKKDLKTLGHFDFAFQPAGFLQFGPIIEFEARVGKTILLGTHFRYSSLGLIYNAINDFDNTMACFGVGASFKHFPGIYQKNKFYYGLAADLEFGDYDDPGDWYGNSFGIVALTNAGYRFRFSSGFFINLGVYTGAYINLVDEWYDRYDYSYHDESGYIQFDAIAEFGLGFEF